MISPKLAIPLLPINSKETLEDKINETESFDEINHQEFVLKCEEEKNFKILKGISILSKMYKNKQQKSDPNLDMTKSLRNVNYSNSIIQTLDLSQMEFDQEYRKEGFSVHGRSDSEEEKKSLRINSRELKSSMNLTMKSTKAMGFRKVRNLTVKTIADINNVSFFSRKGGRSNINQIKINEFI